MPTAAQYGMATPAGTDMINLGDNVITQNADATAKVLTRLESGRFTPQLVPEGADLNTLGDGFWFSRSGALSATIANRPSGIGDNPFDVLIRSSSVGSFKYEVQDFSGYSGTSAGYYRRNTSNAAGTAFIPWRRLDNEAVASSGLAGVANTLRVQEFRDAIGPVATNGRGAVALRFDHGLSNFNTVIRPLLEARGIPYSLALSSRNFNTGENAGVTAAMVNSWNSLCEVWNHGADSHKDESSVGGLMDQIVMGKTELQDMLPNKKIWGYAVPGTGGTGQGGFNGGSTVEQFYSTLAGDLILTNHAVSSGSMTGTARRVIDGRVRQGQAHFTIEAQTVARIKTEIDVAISSRIGSQLMMHPSLLNTAGYLTTAQLTEVLDYIVAKRDSGELVVLSPYQMMLADAQPEKAFISRNITSLWDGGAGGGTVTLTRTGNWVELSVYGNTATADVIKLNPLPAGFRPPSNRIFAEPFYGSSATGERALIYATGRVDIFGITGGANVYAVMSWPTRDSWPSALPGTPA